MWLVHPANALYCDLSTEFTYSVTKRNKNVLDFRISSSMAAANKKSKPLKVFFWTRSIFILSKIRTPSYNMQVIAFLLLYKSLKKQAKNIFGDNSMFYWFILRIISISLRFHQTTRVLIPNKNHNQAFINRKYRKPETWPANYLNNMYTKTY